MLTDNLTAEEIAYNKGLQALKGRDFYAAEGFFKLAKNQFAKNSEFRILYDSTKLLLAVKEELNELNELNNEKVLG